MQKPGRIAGLKVVLGMRQTPRALGSFCWLLQTLRFRLCSDIAARATKSDLAVARYFPFPQNSGATREKVSGRPREEGRELPNSEILSNIKVSNSYSAITPALLRSNNRLLQDSQLLFQQGDQPGVKVIAYCHPFWQQDHAGDAVRGKEIERVQKQNDVRIQHQHRTISISTPIITFDFIFFTFRY